ncbi:MAG: pyridoxal-phosphate dependent enzyme [Myxococcota bacterium]|nr:pyridoxal-phosphate dependent enzyme [Myxococcota bacterium]
MNTAATNTPPTIETIRAAAARLHGRAHRTPVLESRQINALAGARLFFKAENFQRVGAFKFRGAWNTVASLSDEEAARGICTHSSGNHAQAIALAAAERGIPAWIVMPEGAPKVKRDAVIGYGAQVIDCAPTQQAREETAAEVVERNGATFIHPYDDPRVISGQGTAALELIEEVGELDAIIAPIGGGGLMSGSALCARALCPKIRIFGAEPAGADDAARSLKAGRPLPHRPGHPATICDGLLTTIGARPWEIISRELEACFLVSDEEVISALRLIWSRMKILVEASAAVPLAALLSPQAARREIGPRVGVLLSGGNIDLDQLPWAR